MKRFLRQSALCLLLLFLGSCSQQATRQKKSEDKLHVLSTTAMINDLVCAVGGERISTNVLIQGEADPHSYELVKGDDEKIDHADLVFFTGLNLEHAASLRAKILNHPHSVSLGEYIAKEHAELLLWEDGQVDPHIWMDISLWAKTVDPLVEALIAKDPEGASFYRERAKNLQQQMVACHERLRDRMQSIPAEKRYLVTSHDAFGYFTRGYLALDEELSSGDWKNRFKAPEGLSPDGQLGALHLQRIVDHLLEYHIEVVFPESNVSRDSLRKIVVACKEKKAPIRFSQDTLYGDCMGESCSLGGTYLGMIEHNIEVLVKEWQTSKR